MAVARFSAILSSIARVRRYRLRQLFLILVALLHSLFHRGTGYLLVEFFFGIARSAALSIKLLKRVTMV